MTKNINPHIMYGTAWKDNKTEQLTLQALNAGFRAIDTANQRKHYYEAGVGKAIAAFMEVTHIKRDELFIQTKFTHKEGQDHRLNVYDLCGDEDEELGPVALRRPLFEQPTE